ncbi:hypothetical protein SEA_LABELLE_50 [Mycobacterium phage Labelle]|nr:hypothetical protein SEA_LABELLE_50 [Mycobacterium phage Labelle]
MPEPQEITEPRGGIITQINKALMVAYINNHGRYDLDVRKSFVYYNSDGDFVFALSNKLDGPRAQEIFDKLDIKFWSKGIK